MTSVEAASWFGALGSIAQGAATAAAAYVAWKGIGGWRQEQSGLRRQKVAEEALLAIYAARDALREVRHAFIHVGELVDEKGEVLRGDVGTGRAILRRLEGKYPVVVELQRAGLLVEAHFGGSATTPFREFPRLFVEVQAAAQMFMGPNSERYERELRDDMWNAVARGFRPSGEDKIELRAERLVDAARASLLPYLSLDGKSVLREVGWPYRQRDQP